MQARRVREFDTDSPQVSVIIASYNSRNTIEACLRSLQNQTTDKEFEVILVDSSNDGAADLVKAAFPLVRLLHFPERKFPGDARNIGVAAARAKVVAFLDADCEADENWVAEILKAHRDPDVAIGGAVANGNPDSYVGWAAYLCEFSQWMPDGHPRLLTDIPTANMSYKKSVFNDYGRFIEGTYCSDTELHWRLLRGGHRLRWEPSIRVRHRNITDLWRFLRHEFSHGRSFASVRVKGQKFSAQKRLFYVLFSFLIPVKLLAAISARNLRNRIYFWHFLKAWPLLCLGIVSWCLGECAGYAGR